MDFSKGKPNFFSKGINDIVTKFADAISDEDTGIQSVAGGVLEISKDARKARASHILRVNRIPTRAPCKRRR